jgi:hypothetical protein
VLADLGLTADLEPLEWEDVVDRVWLAGYRELCERHRELLDGVTVAALGELASDSESLAAELQRREPELSDDRAVPFSRHLLAAALTLAMVRSGWRAQAPPGEPIGVVRGDRRLVPAELVTDLAKARVSPAAWREQAAGLGVAETQLAEPEPAPA